MFRVAQFVQHDCSPNLGRVVWSGADMAVFEAFAMRDIAAGEMLSTSYVFKVLPRAERRKELGFTCACTTCLASAAPPVLLTWNPNVAGVVMEHKMTRGRLPDTMSAARPPSPPAGSYDTRLEFDREWNAGTLEPLARLPEIADRYHRDRLSTLLQELSCEVDRALEKAPNHTPSQLDTIAEYKRAIAGLTVALQ